MSDIGIHHLGAAYALDALDERERLAFESHFAACEFCRTDVRDFRAAAADLAVLAASPPPGDLRDRVLADIASTRQLSPLPDAVVRLADRRRSRPVVAILGAAAALVCFVLGAVVFGGRGNGFDDTVAAMIKEPGARLVPLTGDGGAALQVLWTDDRAALYGDGVPPAPEGKAYELWLIDDAGATPMGVLDPAGDGTVERVVEIGAAPAAWGITIEPESGSDVPTMPILYVAEVAATA
jgi:anti-sigma-K factor RskA